MDDSLRISLKDLLVLFIMIVLIATDNHAKEDTIDGESGHKFVQPFPSLSNKSRGQLKIVSEVLGASSGSMTLEEYVDFEQKRAAFVAKEGNRKWNVFIDASLNMIARYEPYDCQVETINEGLFDFDLIRETLATDFELESDGLAAVWNFMSNNPRRYENTNAFYSGDKNSYQQAHTWSHSIGSRKIEMYFRDGGGGGVENEMKLQMASLSESRKLLRTYNVISMKTHLSAAEQEKYLELPIGYGCLIGLSKDGIPRGIHEMQARYERALRETLLRMESSTNVKAEITANTLDEATSDSLQSIMNVDLVDIHGEENAAGRLFRILRVQSCHRDVRIVQNYLAHTVHEIDIESGSCKTQYLKAKSDDGSSDALQLELETTAAKLRLNFDALRQAIIHQEHQFRFLKESQPSEKLARIVYFEASGSDDLLLGASKGDMKRSVRVVQAYDLINDDLILRSLTFFQFDQQDQARLLETIQADIIDLRQLAEQDLSSKLDSLDTSEECFLNNEQKVEGRDYAWIAVKYEAPRNVLDSIKSDPENAKRIFYRSAVGLVDNDLVRMPRVELVLLEHSVIFRLLLLDMWPLEYTFKLLPAKSVRQAMISLQSMAADWEHCISFCRLHHCTIMSYCDSQRTCSTASVEPNEVASSIEENKDCVSLVNLDEKFKWNTLHGLLARLEQMNYDESLRDLPNVPDELLLSMEDSGLTHGNYNQLSQDYSNQVLEYLSQQTRVPNELVFQLNDRTILIPSAFELENGPQFDLDLERVAGSYNDVVETAQLDLVASFHRGQQWARFKSNMPHLRLKQGDRAESEFSTRLLQGLSYDQCALVCMESRCGTFSYCNKQQQCVLSSVWILDQARELQLIEPDFDCHLMERDFLEGYQKYAKISEPIEFKLKLEHATGPSECALKCASEADFKCLSFQYCYTTSESKSASRDKYCYLQQDHYMEQIFEMTIESVAHESKPNLVCDHYSRAYLGDFERLEGQAISEKQIGKLISKVRSGLSVSECARECILSDISCTTFQTCLKFVQKRAVTECTLILGWLRSSHKQELGDDKKIVSANQSEGEYSQGRLLEYNADCQVFSMRQDTLETHLREFTLARLLASERDVIGKLEHDVNQEKVSSTLSLEQAMVFFTSFALVSWTINCLFIYLRDTDNELVRSKVDRARHLISY